MPFRLATYIGHVGAAEEAVGIVRVGCAHGDADADALHEALAVSDADGFLHRGLHQHGELLDARRVVALDQHRELVATESGDGVAARPSAVSRAATATSVWSPTA